MPALSRVQGGPLPTLLRGISPHQLWCMLWVCVCLSLLSPLQADTVVFDDELSPGQLRNLEKAFTGGQGGRQVSWLRDRGACLQWLLLCAVCSVLRGAGAGGQGDRAAGRSARERSWCSRDVGSWACTDAGRSHKF